MVAQTLHAIAPSWVGIRIAGAAKYLGFYLGPQRGHLTTQQPVAKYLRRAQDWGGTPSGLFLASAAYSVYVLPVLAFVLQLDELPPGWEEHEAVALRRLATGPGQWCQPQDLRHLKSFGMPKDFASPAQVALAAKLRVATYEAAAAGGLQVDEKAHQLRSWITGTTQELGRLQEWLTPWLERAFVFQLERAAADFAAKQ